MAIKTREIIFWLVVATVIVASFKAIEANAGGITIGTVSDHSGNGRDEDGNKYNEVNPGVCVDSGFAGPFVIACVIDDSRENLKGIGALGYRWIEPTPIKKLHLALMGGPTYGESNVSGNVGGVIAGIVTYGTEKFSTSVVVTPSANDTPEVRYLTFRLGY